jgi:uncharacterized protein (DUF2062 family)
MVLGRRTRPHFWKRARELVWPRGGWQRASKYVAHRVRRLPGSPYSIACGFACGASVSFTPLIGLHFVLAAGLSLALGGNLIASAIGTAVGNPWTFPLIWAGIYWLGRVLLGYPAEAALPDELTLGYIFDHTWEVFYPMLVGGIPSALAVWLIFFWPCYKAVARYQAHRAARRERARARRAGRLAGGGPRAEAKGEQ